MQCGRVQTQDNTRGPTQETQTAVNTTTNYIRNKSWWISHHYMLVIL